MGRIRLVMFALVTIAAPAAAQEVGVLVSALDSELVGVGIRAGVSVSDRSTFEASVEWMDLGRKRYYADQLVWVSTVQGRRRIQGDQRHGSSVFITYGATGFANRTTRPSGMELFFVPPLLPTVGVGWHYGSEGRLGARVDLQTLWLVGESLVGPRVSAGASLRIR
jgi:hypothetical protein